MNGFRKHTICLILNLILFSAFYSCSKDNSPSANQSDERIDIEGYKLVWNDEFSGTEIDKTKWEHEVNADGGGNNELQYYTDRSQNSFLENGTLKLVALQEEFTLKGITRYYTSARLRTLNKGDWLYGRIEVRAKIPYGQGLWPAVWMLPTAWAYGGWPKSGEIDIMEHVGFDPGKIYGSIHTEAYNHKIGTQKGGQLLIANANSEYHVYAIEWFEDRIDFYVDKTKYFSFANDNKGDYKTWPFNKKFHLLLNVAVGGDWPGNPTTNTIFPKVMQIDYVRVYERSI